MSIFSEDRDVTASVKARIEKFYGVANAVIGKIGALSGVEEIWRQDDYESRANVSTCKY